KGSAAAGKVTTLAVKEEMVTGETISLLAADIPQVLMYSRTSEVPKSVREALAKVAQLKQAELDIDAQRRSRMQEIAAITTEQNRIRENMKTVAPSTQYYERLLAKLNEQESAIERLQKEIADLAPRAAAAHEALEAYLRGLEL
ncbi:MAG: hypothetical protein ACREBE_16450, partial [bacterium]